MQQQPSIGRIVHFRPGVVGDPEPADTCLAAIITAVKDPAGAAGGGIIDLTFFTPSAPFGSAHAEDVSYVSADRLLPSTWHFPEHVEPTPDPFVAELAGDTANGTPQEA